MAELEWQEGPERPSLRRAIRHRLRRERPDLRVVAEGFLAADSEIDLLAVGPDGELVSIRIGRRDDDGALLTCALADLAWLRPRVGDLAGLAPDLGLEPSRDPRALLLCPGFSSETQLAASLLPARAVELVGYRCLRSQGQLTALLENPKPDPPASAVGLAPRPATSDPASHARSDGARPDGRLTDPPSASHFRTGLCDADLASETPFERRSALGESARAS